MARRLAVSKVIPTRHLVIFLSNRRFTGHLEQKCKRKLCLEYIRSVALLWWNRKCKFANKRAQANAHRSKWPLHWNWLSLGFTLHFAFPQSKATEPMPYYCIFIAVKIAENVLSTYLLVQQTNRLFPTIYMLKHMRFL